MTTQDKAYAKLMELGRQVIAAEKIFGANTYPHRRAVTAWKRQQEKMGIETAPAVPKREKLLAGTTVEVVDPNYKTRVVGVLREDRFTGAYYEPVIVAQGNGRVAACGYISKWEGR